MTQHVLEWSKKTNQFHVRPVAEMLAGNQKWFLDDNSHDFLVLMVGTAEVCHSMADTHWPRLRERVELQCSTETT